MSQIKNYQTSKLYQFTAIDTFSRLRMLEGYLEQSTYTAWLFLVQVLSFYEAHEIEVKMVQTDNGPIFTNRFLTTNNDKFTLFEQELKKRHIRYKTIKAYTPKHNGKVERSHREDQRRLYSEMIRLDQLLTDIGSFKQ